MVLGPDCVSWMDAPPVDDTVNWTRDADVAGDEMDPKSPHPTDISMSMPCSFSTFKSMLDADPSWYLNPPPPPPPLHDLSGHLHHNPHAFKDLTFCPNPIPETNNNNNNNAMFFDPSSCSSSPAAAAAFLNQQTFIGFDLAPEPLHYLPPFQLNPNSANTTTNNNNPAGLSSGSLGASGFGFHGGVDGGTSNALFFNRPKVLRPLEVMPQTGSQPTLFQKRAAKLGNLEISGAKRKRAVDDNGDLDDDLSGINYDSDDDGIDFTGQHHIMGSGSENNNDAAGGGGGSNSVANSGVTAGEGSDPKGKKKGMPAKNLMAERRRRKKLNDRLYMLRSVVPKISKMDRASILGDAIDYLKELLQRISDLHNELESSSTTPQGLGGGASATPASFHPLTPTPPTLPCRVKDELCPTTLHSPKGQPPAAAARVEVRAREGRAVNIHMFCARRPGLLLSTMRALDALGLDIQQAVISCFNGFALDVFRAEQCRDGQDVLPEQIKAMLLDSAGITNMI